jgi:hypothetical protein
MNNIYVPLSNHDLQDFFNDLIKKECNIKMYDDIKKMKNIDEVFEKNKYCIIFVSNPNKKIKIGHWVIVFYNDPKNANFFCSYGTEISEICPWLGKLLFQKFQSINSNAASYQKIGDDSATCGRWCLLVLAMLNIIKNFNFFIFNSFIDYEMKTNRMKTCNEVVAKYVDINIE